MYIFSLDDVTLRVARWYFFIPKIPIWVYFGIENVGIFYGYWDYFTAICYIFRPFGNFVVICYILPLFGTLHQEKSGNPGHTGNN
jgi:hypothetical protein